jgi:diguanylate cyclase
MLAIYDYMTKANDPRFVALAAGIGLLASFAALSLLHHVRRSTGPMRHVWLAVAATSFGFGIWATHFIALLAFTPGVPSAFNVSLTLLSLAASICLAGASLAAAVASRAAIGTYLGGVMVGVGIAAMHYTGMAAFEVKGRINWDPGLVSLSILLGAVLEAAALFAGLRSDSLKARMLGAVLLTFAIGTNHFTALGAATIVPHSSVEFSGIALRETWLVLAVAAVSAIVVILAFAGIAIDLSARTREFARMRDLSNATVEGLLLCDDQTIVTVNDSFAVLSGSPADRLIGLSLEQSIPNKITRAKLLQRPNEAIEGELRQANGSKIPVELIMHPITFDGKPHRAIAVRDLRARKLAEQQIHFLAHYDTLTGIPNRASFNKRLEEDIKYALATGRPLALLCLDLDHFKEVNDLFGHAAGDKLLQFVARQIHGVLDSNQMLARLGGDEFAVVAPGLFSEAAAGRIAERILEVLHVMPENSELPAPVLSSIGIAICPRDATSRSELLCYADTALYCAKRDGRGTYRFFEASMGAAIRDRSRLESDLRQALEHGEFRLVYQPIKNIRTNRFTGFEALVRWKHPSRGEVLPSEFIPIAEDTGVILPLGNWVLREACREAASWAAPLSVAVNISAAQIHTAGFANTVHEILTETGLARSRLVIEVTETALIRDLTRAQEVLGQIKMLGVRIAMDDFGTGYSSLSNLRAFPFDKIKIDKSFIQSVNVNSQQAAIVRSVIGLGRALNLKVLAEGVENQAELEFLEDEACDEVQGFLIGIPRNIDVFREITHPGNAARRQSTVVPLPPNVASMRSA